MHYAIEKLMRGDAGVATAFSSAHKKWAELLKDVDSVSEADLAERLSNEQTWFEETAGGRGEGKELMGWTGFAFLCPNSSGWDGNESRGVKLLKAFGGSSCSLEVKTYAKRAAQSYHLDV